MEAMIGEQVGTPARSQQIVAVAHELLDESGLEGLTIRAVLTRSGLARRAFYDCFSGKDDLVLAVFAHTLRLAADHFAAEIRALPDPMARLHHIVEAIVLGRVASGRSAQGGRRRGAALSREHLRLAESRPAELQAAISPLIDLIAQQLSDGIAIGQVRPAPPQRLAELIYNLVSTTVHGQLLAEEITLAAADDRAELLAQIWAFCRRAVAADK
ncbi:TetR family transcriptional regulator [Sphingobium sp. BYY-5]|uniref:TetR/AcrR family transcriptional regulator n=1 Tax=Sphingobium sp. BYY-5 TaxID=2926400 RepID=UPI001FA6F175|nr:TetR family transcriptional regulator [Sphingobium sp. BYY-5]MCI4591823.1 TetR family transcriptional regulator [Sphingobium sp. BYY-5]